MIGPAFSDELEDAGLTGLPFVWSDNGIEFAPDFPADKRAQVLAVLAAHNPAKQSRAQKEAEAERIERQAIVQLIKFAIGNPQQRQEADAELRSIAQQIQNLRGELKAARRS